jgi:hypothetical protein
MRCPMDIGLTSILAQPVLGLLVGILILLLPRFLNDFAAAYLIVIGGSG